MLTVIENNEVTTSLRRLWELESIGITEAENLTMSQNEKYAVDEFNKGLKFDRENYEVKLPWRKDHPRMENNYEQVEKRVESIKKRLKRDPVKAEAYSAAINQYVEKRFCRRSTWAGKQRWYCPWLTTPCRVPRRQKYKKVQNCFWCSRTTRGRSFLNDCILPGPALQPNLASVLIRFRTNRIGLMANV